MIFNSNVGSLLNPGSGGYGAAFEKAVMHGIVRAGMAKLQGQKVSAGFWSGFVASGFAAPKSWGIKEGTFVNAVVGGTTSELTGGKFANGAVTGAFVHLFNAEAKNFKWDLDHNGKMSLEEADNWWKNGGGETVDINASKLIVLDFKNYDIVFGIEDYMVHGAVSLSPNGGIYESVYDFDYKIRGDFLSGLRNAGNTLGLFRAGPGTPFKTRFFGKPKVIKIGW